MEVAGKILTITILVLLLAGGIAVPRHWPQFCWYAADIDGGLTCNHYHVFVSVNGGVYSFVEDWVGPHLDGKSGSASAPYQLPGDVVYEASDVVLIKVQAMDQDHIGGVLSSPISPMADGIGKPSKAICTKEI